MKKILLLVAAIFIFTSAFAKPQHKNDIFVYNDQGVSADSLQQTLYFLEQSMGQTYRIRTLNANEVKHGDWQKTAALFVMPGGADLPYLRLLSGKGNQQIINYVKKGGHYLGFCAGSYYAADSIVFAPNTPLEVKGERELKFFPGQVIGPAFPGFEYHSEAGARAAKIVLNDSRVHKNHNQNNALYVYYNGGGYFLPRDQKNNCTVLGRYDNLPNKPIAIVQCQVGKGRVLLSGLHFEYSYRFLDPENKYQKRFISTLQKNDNQRLKMAKRFLHHLGV